jgi:hypothetical protein
VDVIQYIIQHRRLCGQEGNRSCRMLRSFEDRREIYCVVLMVLEGRYSYMTVYRMRVRVYKQRINNKQTSACVERAFQSKYLIV